MTVGFWIRVAAVLWVLSGALALGRSFTSDETFGEPAEPEEVGASTATIRMTVAPDSSVVHRIVRGNVFHPSRQPVDLQSQPTMDPGVGLSVELIGVVLGDEPAAILRGIPDHDGSHVVQVGEAVGGLVVRRVEADAAVLLWGGDTITIRLASGVQ